MYFESLACCGIGEILDVCEATKSSLAELIQTANAARHGLLLATTIVDGFSCDEEDCDCDSRDDPYPKVEALLKEAGFELVKEFKNPNTKSVLRLWLLDMTQKKNKEEKDA